MYISLLLAVGSFVIRTAVAAPKAPAANPSSPVAATRFFRVTQEKGVSHFVAPDGKPFFSLGVCGVDQGATAEKYSWSKPEYAAFRSYPNARAWGDTAMARLRSWNFNTVGGWSAAEVQDGMMPYTVVLHLGANLWPGAPWGDLFDEKSYAAKFDEVARREVLPRRDDPQLLGYFTDNELGWWDDTLFLYFFNQPVENKTRQVLMQVLRTHYGDDFSRLQRDFQTGSTKSFEALTPSTRLTLREGGNGMQAVDEFVFRLAQQYYRIVNEAIRRYDPNHLILGDRYAGWYPPAVARAAGSYVDVISTNYGADWTNGNTTHFFLDTLHELSGKPILIGEFYFAAMENRSGNKNSGRIFPTLQTQRERAQSYRRYVENIASRPYMVGAHWFQFHDEPTFGRGDGEDFNMGLVDIQDIPYEALTSAAAEVHAQVPELHAHATLPEKTKIADVPAAPKAVRDGLETWDVQRAWIAASTRAPVADLYVCWDENYLYVAAYAADFFEKKLYPNDKIPPGERMQFTVKLDQPKPLQVRFGPGGEAISNPPFWTKQWQRSVNAGAIVAISASYFGKNTLRAGRTISLRADLTTHSRAEHIGWNTTLRLH